MNNIGVFLQKNPRFFTIRFYLLTTIPMGRSKKLLIVLVLLVIVVVAERGHLWWFQTISPKERLVWPYVMAYTTFTGPYAQMGPVMDQIAQSLSGAGIMPKQGIGIYYTNPADHSGSMRSDIGSVIANKIPATSWYQIQTIKANIRVVIAFPYRNILSYMVGPMKVYPIMNAYMQAKGYNTNVPRIEVYDMKAKQIFFIADIVK